MNGSRHVMYNARNKKQVFIIAEAGVNHNGDLSLARHLIDVAAQAGADAVKFQLFNIAALVTASARMAHYQKMSAKRSDPSSDRQRDMLETLAISDQDMAELVNYGRRQGIEVMATPFDPEKADLLEKLGIKRFKISSGDLTHLELLAHIAAKKLPMIVSTGMATLGEVEEAVQIIRQTGNPPLTLLHCVSSYPSRPEDANLRAMETMAKAFDVETGWSDHMPDATICLAAVAMGARVIEKHLTLDRNLPGPDHKASMEPEDFTDMVQDIRKISRALGSGVKTPVAAEADVMQVARRSLVTACAIPAGTRLAPDMLVAKRPGTGLAPRYKAMVTGKTTIRDLPPDTVLDWSDLCAK